VNPKLLIIPLVHMLNCLHCGEVVRGQHAEAVHNGGMVYFLLFPCVCGYRMGWLTTPSGVPMVDLNAVSFS